MFGIGQSNACKNIEIEDIKLGRRVMINLSKVCHVKLECDTISIYFNSYNIDFTFSDIEKAEVMFNKLKELI